jgi:hypothetical protein
MIIDFLNDNLTIVPNFVSNDLPKDLISIFCFLKYGETIYISKFQTSDYQKKI